MRSALVGAVHAYLYNHPPISAIVYHINFSHARHN
jgi:hypothetical protein